MIRLGCPHCGQEFTVSDGQAGKAGRCPRCQGRIVVPPVAPGPSVISPELFAAPPASADPSQVRDPPTSRSQNPTPPSDALDQRLLNVPPPGSGSIPAGHLSEAQVLAKLRFKPPPEYTGERRLPWPVDILLYPANSAGLLTLAILIGIPLLLTVLQQVVFLPFLGLVFFLAKLALGVCGVWYGAECTYDSAQGGTRAPQILDSAGYGDKWSRVSHLLVVYLLFVLPAVLYSWHTGRRDVIFWLLIAWAVLFFPMGLLAMIVNDGTYVLNPLFLLRSIFRTLVPYLGLLALIAAVTVSLWLMMGRLESRMSSLGMIVLGLFPAGYSSLLAAHILGRFYWRYRERLDWDL